MRVEKIQKKGAFMFKRKAGRPKEKFLPDDKFNAADLRASKLAFTIVTAGQAGNPVAILACTKYVCEQDGIQMDSDEGLLTLAMAAHLCGVYSGERTE